MLPDIRLLAVAVLAAIAGISCGLGLFATFRVNHEPLVRFSEGGPPLQIALDNRSAAEAGFPIAARLPFNNAAKPASTPVLIPTSPPVADGSQTDVELGSSGSGLRTTQEGGERSEGAAPSVAEDGSIATTPATSEIESTEAQ